VAVCQELFGRCPRADSRG